VNASNIRGPAIEIQDESDAAIVENNSTSGRTEVIFPMKRKTKLCAAKKEKERKKNEGGKEG